MNTLTHTEILDLWEAGRQLHPLDRSLVALRALRGSQADDVADWPLGRRNRSLFELHSSCFGPSLQGWTDCPECHEKLEFELDARELLPSDPAREASGDVVVGQRQFRLPTSRDLASALQLEDGEGASRHIMERCCLGELSPMGQELLEEAEEAMATADPGAEVRLGLVCPTCETSWQATLDIADFIWAEIDVRARRLLWEVHTLAVAYGWSESETLHLSPARRALYVEMVGP
jgi:hypothetical protein